MNKSHIERRLISCILTSENWSKVAERVARLLVNFPPELRRIHKVVVSAQIEKAKD